jgi:hypothetical protein
VANAMKIYLKEILLVTFLTTLLASCGKAEFIPSPSVNNHITSTAIPLPTYIVIPPTLEQVTPEASDFSCTPNKIMEGWETSPDGKWMTSGFYLENKQDNLLRVVSLDCLKNWGIYLSNYKEIGSFDHHDGFIPYHWSQDGKFLYAIVGQRFSGCCWKGLRFVLLVRLNLETGEQMEILNTGSNTGYIFDFAISDNDRYITFTPPQGQSYDFAVLDIATWKAKEFTIEFSEAIDIFYSAISPNGDKIVLPLFENIEFNDYFINSIGLVDLVTGKQEILVSGLTQEGELYPVRWLDDSHVLLSNTNPKFNQDGQSAVEYWSLNIVTREMEKQDNP